MPNLNNYKFKNHLDVDNILLQYFNSNVNYINAFGSVARMKAQIIFILERFNIEVTNKSLIYFTKCARYGMDPKEICGKLTKLLENDKH